MNVLKVLSCAAVMQMLWMFAGCCSGGITITYEWRGMKLTHLDNSGTFPDTSSKAQIPAQAYGIRMMLDTHLISSIRGSSFPTAHATSCEPLETYINRDTVLAIRIYSLAPNGGTPPKEVSDDFKAMVPWAPAYGLGEEIQMVTGLPNVMNGSRNRPDIRFDLLRTSNHEPGSGMRFIVRMELSGGKVIADTTSPITLL